MGLTTAILDSAIIDQSMNIIISFLMGAIIYFKKFPSELFPNAPIHFLSKKLKERLCKLLTCFDRPARRTAKDVL